jgi:hypothetical protein
VCGQIATGALLVEQVKALRVGREFDPGTSQLAAWEMRELVGMTMAGCQLVPGAAVRQGLDQKPGACGSEGNSCLPALVKVVIHSVCISLQGPIMIITNVVLSGHYCSQRITVSKVNCGCLNGYGVVGVWGWGSLDMKV